tara:strand:+ start:180 stop:599 length:420 start_codon:yes stop_codon:yes gene_type:complete
MNIYRIKNRSMEPYLHNNDLILTRKWDTPKRGQILLMRSKIYPNQLNIKRLVGLPGDKIAIKEGSLWLNGRGLTEPYLKSTPASSLEIDRDWVVPEGTVFVLSDNRILGTEDSRKYGPIPKQSVECQMIMRIWPLIRLK